MHTEDRIFHHPLNRVFASPSTPCNPLVYDTIYHRVDSCEWTLHPHSSCQTLDDDVQCPFSLILVLHDVSTCSVLFHFVDRCRMVIIASSMFSVFGGILTRRRLSSRLPLPFAFYIHKSSDIGHASSLGSPGSATK